MGGFLPAIIGGGLNLLGGLLGGKQKNDQQAQNAQLQNQYLQNYGAGQHNYLDYLKGIGPQTTTSTGGFGSNTNTSNQGTSSNTGFNQGISSFAPTVSAQFSPLVGRINGMLQSRLSSGGLPLGYQSNAVRNINNTYSAIKQAAANQAARYGLAGPQAMALQEPMEQARAGQIADFQANLPLQQRALQDQDIQTAMNLANIFGKGQTGTSSNASNSMGNTSNIGSSNNSGFDNRSTTGPAPIAPMAAFLPPGPQAGGPVDPTLNVIQGGLGQAGDLFGAWAQNQARNDYMKALQNGGGQSPWSSPYIPPGQVGSTLPGPPAPGQ